MTGTDSYHLKGRCIDDCDSDSRCSTTDFTYIIDYYCILQQKRMVPLMTLPSVLTPLVIVCMQPTADGLCCGMCNLIRILK